MLLVCKIMLSNIIYVQNYTESIKMTVLSLLSGTYRPTVVFISDRMLLTLKYLRSIYYVRTRETCVLFTPIRNCSFPRKCKPSTTIYRVGIGYPSRFTALSVDPLVPCSIHISKQISMAAVFCSINSI